MPLDDDGGWGRDGQIASNMLYVYRPDGEKEKVFIRYIAGASHEGRLFLHDKCTGNRASYTAKHVNQLLTREENPEGIKERIVTLVPHLSLQQKQWLADGISDDALLVVSNIDHEAAQMLASLRKADKAAHVSAPQR